LTILPAESRRTRPRSSRLRVRQPGVNPAHDRPQVVRRRGRVRVHQPGLFVTTCVEQSGVASLSTHTGRLVERLAGPCAANAARIGSWMQSVTPMVTRDPSRSGQEIATDPTEPSSFVEGMGPNTRPQSRGAI